MLFCIDTETQEVHKIKCKYLTEKNLKILGKFNYTRTALNEAKDKGFFDAKTCLWCCSE